MDQLDSAQTGNSVTANENFAAMLPASFGGRHASACVALTWGYYGGRWGGTLIADGTLTLSPSAVNYIVCALATGVISLDVSSPADWEDTINFARLYKVTTGSAAVTSYEDHRAGPGGFVGGGPDALLAVNNLSDVASASASRSHLGLGSAALLASSAVAQTANNLSDLSNAGTARTNLGLAIGTNVQAYDAELAAIAGLTSAADRLPYFTGSGTASLATFSSFARTLIDDADAAAARSTLGLASVGSTTSIQIDEYTSGTPTWTKPAGAKFVEIICVGGGGGGGGGSASNSSNGVGGSGGGGGALVRFWVEASKLGGTENIIVGTGGPGGTTVTSTLTGNPGTAGNPSSLGARYYAYGGGGGAGGTNNSTYGGGGGGSYGAGAVGGPGSGSAAGGDGGGGASTSGNGAPTTNGFANGGAPGGGTLVTASSNGGPGGLAAQGSCGGAGGGNSGGAGGGGKDVSGSIAAAGGSTGNNGGTVAGLAGGYRGAGGGGGGGRTGGGAAPGNGGAGQQPGGGGGGGGGTAANGQAGGAGGAGGDGIVVVITYF